MRLSSVRGRGLALHLIGYITVAIGLGRALLLSRHHIGLCVVGLIRVLRHILQVCLLLLRRHTSACG
jgi:hypothetical protein